MIWNSRVTVEYMGICKKENWDMWKIKPRKGMR